MDCVLTGELVTIDAMGCQTKIAQTVIDRGADYLLALKDNQRCLANEVELFFEARANRCGEPFETVDNDRGRIDTRHHFVSHDVSWLTTERRFPGEPRFPGPKNMATIKHMAMNLIRSATLAPGGSIPQPRLCARPGERRQRRSRASFSCLADLRG
jgi:predicted transposase YbfD/YdcC